MLVERRASPGPADDAPARSRGLAGGHDRLSWRCYCDGQDLITRMAQADGIRVTWSEFMDELRARHLHGVAPGPDGVLARLTAAYDDARDS